MSGTSGMVPAASPVGRILGSLDARGPTPETADRIGRLLGGLDDHGELVRAAERERLAPLLHASLARADLVGRVDPGAAERIALLYRRTALANLRRAVDVEELLAGAGERGVRPVLLKGIVLLETLYRDPGRRPMSDVDLWVSEAEAERLGAWLEEAGYARDTLYPGTYRRGPTTLDVHTSLLGDRIDSRRELLAGGEDPVRRRLRPFDYRGQRAWRLDPLDEIVYLALHALKHSVERLVWLVDLAGLPAAGAGMDREVEAASGADRPPGRGAPEASLEVGGGAREALLEVARETGQEATLQQVGFLVDGLLEGRSGTLLGRIAAAGAPGRLERWILAHRIRGARLPSWAPLLLFAPRAGPGARARFVLETLFPRPAILRQTLHDAEDLRPWQLYWRRFFQLIERAVR